MKPETAKSDRDAKFEKTSEFQNFKAQMSKLLKVSKKQLDERIAEYDKKSPHKRTKAPSPKHG